MTLPRCPACNGKSEHAKGGNYRCTRCGGLHDGLPNEGGTHYADPSKRMEVEEREASRKPRRPGRPLRGGI